MPATATTEFTYTFNGRKNSYGEFVVRCYRFGKRYEAGDYFASDKSDAEETKKRMELEEWRKQPIADWQI